MQRARLILCEKKGHWATALRRHLTATSIRVFETRSHDECWDELQLSPASFVGLELTADRVVSVAEFVTRAIRQFREARFALLGQRETQQYEWMLREVGAIDAVFSPQYLESVAILAQRHLSAAPSANLSLREGIMSRLPWGNGQATIG